MKLIHFLIKFDNKQILLAGKVPHTYGTMAALDTLDYSALRDLGTWASAYAGYGFLTYEDAVERGVDPAALQSAQEGAMQAEWASLDPTRQELIQAQRWRIDRFDDESKLNEPHKEDIAPVLKYVKAIRDLTETNPDPFNIVWPVPPALPAT